MNNIAIVGGFAAGKTTLSEGLVQQGYTRVSFARYLKQIAARIYNEGVEVDKVGQYGVTSLSGDLHILSGREILQQLGQAVKSLDRDFWIKSLLADLDNGNYGGGPWVTDDCRFPYEAEALTDNGFLVIKLDVPLDVRIQRYEQTYGRKPTPDELVHPSEIELVDIDPDFVIDGTQEPKAILTEAMRYAQAVTL